MKLNKLLPALLVAMVFAKSLFAEVTVVNPVPGTYANPQTLVIEANGGEELYYSFSGTDPLVQGFAYDGPVLLDVTGNVEVRVVSLDAEQNRTERKVSYSVSPAEPENAEHSAFIKSMETGPVFEYTAGSGISIPFTMSYSFADSSEEKVSFERGRKISLSQAATVERFLPVTITDSVSFWRFVVHILPSQAGVLSRKPVPFKIQNWSKLIFTDSRTIYSLDGDWWQSAAQVLTIDRSESNKIYFQSADYSAENPVTEVVLPPKPSLSVERQFDGSVKISVDKKSVNTDSFCLASSASAKTRLVAPGLYKEIVIDTFAGDKIDENLPLDVYCDGVYQGTLLASVELNRVTPDIPDIHASFTGPYSRDDVYLTASASKKLKLFASISDPVEIQPSFTMPDLKSVKFSQGDFSAYDGKRITLFADTEKILAYRVSFYSEDEDGTKSANAEYSVIIDKYNYYVDASSACQDEDGSPFSPFKSLAGLSKVVNSGAFARFFVRGDASLSSGEVSLTANVEFSGTDGARIILPANSVIVMKNAGLFARNIVFEKVSGTAAAKKPRAAAKALTNMFILNHSAATFKDCAVIAGFSGDGSVFSLSGSALSIESTGITSSAQGYTCALSAGDSKINIKNSRVLCVGDTAVNFSVNGGTVFLENNFAQISARMGRPAEFIDAGVSLVDNKFTAEIAGKGPGFKMIYTAGKTKFLADEGNIYK